jgi:hypothetical protein
MRNPPISLEELDSIIDRAVRWEYEPTKRAFLAHLDGGTQSPMLSKSILNKKDARLFQALRFFTQQVREDAAAVRMTLAFWADPAPMMQQLGQNTLRYTAAIHAYTATTFGGEIMLAVTYADIIKQAGVLVADGHQHTSTRRYHPDFLEPYYPGFSERLACAISLGMDPVAIAKSVFGKVDLATPMQLPSNLEASLG